MVFEKKKVLEACAREGSVDEKDCAVCDRPKSTVRCNAAHCSYRSPGLRVRKKCPEHPMVLNLMDLANCPKCKSTDLQEGCVDEMKMKVPTKRVSFASQPSKMYIKPNRNSLPSDSSEEEGDILPRRLLALSTRTDGGSNVARPRNIMETTAPAPKKLTAPVTPPERTNIVPTTCICCRRVRFVLCSNCGFYDGSGEAKKYTPCRQHGSESPGFKNCPDCNCLADECMDEIC